MLAFYKVLPLAQICFHTPPPDILTHFASPPSLEGGNFLCLWGQGYGSFLEWLIATLTFSPERCHTHAPSKKQCAICCRDSWIGKDIWCEMSNFVHADSYSIVSLKGINNFFKGIVEFRIVAPWSHMCKACSFLDTYHF